jgi:hypothetical protein
MTDTKHLPAFRIYGVTKPSEENQAVWQEIGAAWKHKDGKGHTLQFRALPMIGAQVILREPKTSATPGKK